MAKEMCRYHPTVFASGRCKQCAVPLCDDCKIVRPFGIFCSKTCAGKFKEFQDNLAAHDSTSKKSFALPFSMKKILIAVAALAAFVLFMHFCYELDSPTQLPRALQSMWSDLMGIF
jgi:hypothetical protein